MSIPPTEENQARQGSAARPSKLTLSASFSCSRDVSAGFPFLVRVKLLRIVFPHTCIGCFSLHPLCVCVCVCVCVCDAFISFDALGLAGTLAGRERPHSHLSIDVKLFFLLCVCWFVCYSEPSFPWIALSIFPFFQAVEVSFAAYPQPTGCKLSISISISSLHVKGALLWLADEVLLTVLIKPLSPTFSFVWVRLRSCCHHHTGTHTHRCVSRAREMHCCLRLFCIACAPGDSTLASWLSRRRGITTGRRKFKFGMALIWIEFKLCSRSRQSGEIWREVCISRPCTNLDWF